MTISRRQLLEIACASPFVARAQTRPPGELLKRELGRLNFEATTLGLGGQGSLQWTPEGEHPLPIILKAFHLGINYFDTSNAYGPSQLNYGKRSVNCTSSLVPPGTTRSCGTPFS